MVAPHIETREAWVEFPIFDAKSRSLKKAFLGKAGGSIGRNSSNVVVVEALRDITMSLEMGDRVGLVGHNGAGKSTLLRLLSGIYEPTRGVATVHGRVAPVFDLGVGMDPEISGFENIIIRGLFLGQTRKQMMAKVDEIAEFTELGEYLSMPLRTYSTGMRVRLAMGVRGGSGQIRQCLRPLQGGLWPSVARGIWQAGPRKHSARDRYEQTWSKLGPDAEGARSSRSGFRPARSRNFRRVPMLSRTAQCRRR